MKAMVFWRLSPKRPAAGLTASALVFWASVTAIWMIPFLGWLFLLGTPLDESFVQAFNGAERHRHHLGAALITLVAGAVLLWLVAAACGAVSVRAFRWVCDCLVLFGLLVALNSLRIDHFKFLSYDVIAGWDPTARWSLGIGMGLMLLLSFPLLRYASYAFTWIAVPFVPILMANFAYGAHQLAPTPTALLTNPPLREVRSDTPADAPRVLWIIFDEFDHRLVFEARPDGIDLPTVDAIAAQSFVATQAVPPGSFTWISVPGMLVGERISALGRSRRSAELSVTMPNGEDRTFADIGSVFQDVASRDLNTTILSHWAFPFCDMFHNLTAKCWWRSGWALDGNDSVFARIPRIFDRVLTSIPLFERVVFGAPRDGYRTWQDYVETVKTLKSDLASVASDPAVSFVFAHINVPHEPFIYDAATDSFADAPVQRSGYLGNLELMDLILKETKDRMTAAAVWDSTHVIITSDHPWRDNTHDGVVDRHRVPLLIKLAGQRQRLVFDDEIQLTGLRRLVRDLFERPNYRPEWIPQAMSGAGP